MTPFIGGPLRQGDDGPHVIELYAYLERYGYIASDRPDRFGKRSAAGAKLPATVDRYDAAMAEAVRLFQRTYKIKEDGIVADETLALMRMPRCGVPDIIYGQPATRYNTYCPWRRRDLRWHIHEVLPQIGEAHRQIFVDQLMKWANVANLQISAGPAGSQIQSFNYVDDGPGGTFAYACYPCSGSCSGDCHFDLYDAWSSADVTPSNRVDFVSVALHEIGHALGMLHSPGHRDAVMYPKFAFSEQRRSLTQDDIGGIRELYP